MTDFLASMYHAPYDHDDVAHELGLPRLTADQLISTGGNRGWVHWADVPLTWEDSAEPYAMVRIEIMAMPAQFFRFTIEPKSGDGQACVLSTGSGKVSDYWPSVLLVAQGMLVIDSVASVAHPSPEG
jgi:hypothetical protein